MANIILWKLLSHHREISVMCTRPRYQVSVYRTGPLVFRLYYCLNPFIVKCSIIRLSGHELMTEFF